ncbi:protein kinase domain-containing protein [Catenulispora subtropica]|uniref:Protein kinase domain-containing protein n=1 Tax=Catenulispora subtropica TaxID=450798 RepID=A0ABN2RUD5_9ACTN
MTRPLRSTDPGTIGEYELIGRIGGGGMGDVFLGRSPGGRLAAVKVVRDLLADDPGFRARFRREVAAARKVGGAYTAPVLDADPDAERPWLATAYIDGPSLADKVDDDGPLAADEVRRLGAGLAEALRDIHRAGLVHRDLKPGNVLLAADGPRLIDFGIIRAEDGAGLTETGFVLGSAGYMAPEQALGGDATAAADIYALGAVLTFAATGKGPFGSGPAPTVLLRQASSTPDLAEVPEGLRGVVGRCLESDPKSRPSTRELLTLFGDDGGRRQPNRDTPKKARTEKPPKDATLLGPDAIIAATPTTVMPLEKASPKGDPRRAHPVPPAHPTPHPTRRKFLIFGGLGLAALSIGAGIAAMPGGDTKATGGEVGKDSGADTGAELPTRKAPGLLGGPLKEPLWSQTVPSYAEILTAANGTVLVAGSGLAVLDGATGTRRWAADSPVDHTFTELYRGSLPVAGDTVYELSYGSGELIALSTEDGTQSWSVPPPVDWLPNGLVGASSDVVVVWSSPKSAPASSSGLWAVDARSRRQTWKTPLDAFDGAPHYSEGTGLVLISQPGGYQLTAYRADTGTLAWTAQDLSQQQGQDSAFATAITSHGKTVYWAANRLYALDENGHHLWPVGASEGGDRGMFHAVVADDDTVYAAAEVSLGADVITAFKASDGAPKWRAAWPKDFRNPNLECEMALGGRNLYIVDRYSQTLVALDAATGETLWQYHEKAPKDSAHDWHWHVAADDAYVYIGYASTVRAFTAR